MNRKSFIESHGATCRNWNWSWSFINEKDKTIIFGAWDIYKKETASMIMSEYWEKRTQTGGKRPGYKQSIEHLSRISNDGYKLKIFHMKFLGDKKDGFKAAKIKGFEKKLITKKLVKKSVHWFACDEDISEKDFKCLNKISADRHNIV